MQQNLKEIVKDTFYKKIRMSFQFAFELIHHWGLKTRTFIYSKAVRYKFTRPKFILIGQLITNNNYLYKIKSMGTMQKSASIDSFYTNVTFNQPQAPNGNGMAYMATPSMGSAPFRPLNNKPISQGDLTAAMMMMKPPAAAATFLPPETSKKTHHSLTDIENKSLDVANNAQHRYQVHNHNVSSISAPTAKAGGKTIDPDLSFLEQITRMQSNRYDDQRCALKPTATVSKKTNTKAAASTIPNEDFFDLIIKSQRTRFVIFSSYFKNNIMLDFLCYF